MNGLRFDQHPKDKDTMSSTVDVSILHHHKHTPKKMWNTIRVHCDAVPLAP